LHCPIGVSSIASKLPAAIAIAIAAQLLQTDAAIAAAPPMDANPACAAAGACNGCGAPQGS
jgi:xanthine dehydrogenase accessory factor